MDRCAQFKIAKHFQDILKCSLTTKSLHCKTEMSERISHPAQELLSLLHPAMKIAPSDEHESSCIFPDSSCFQGPLYSDILARLPKYYFGVFFSPLSLLETQ